MGRLFGAKEVLCMLCLAVETVGIANRVSKYRWDLCYEYEGAIFSVSIASCTVLLELQVYRSFLIAQVRKHLQA